MEVAQLRKKSIEFVRDNEEHRGRDAKPKRCTGSESDNSENELEREIQRRVKEAVANAPMRDSSRKRG